MIERQPSTTYRKPTKARLAQGDLAMCEFVQLRSASGSEARGPGPSDAASADIPFLGEHQDFEFPVSGPRGSAETRIVRVWTGLAMVLTQNCEVQWAEGDDSRVAVAPVVPRAQWPEGPWDVLPRTAPPGYFYLPPLNDEHAAELGLESAWQESVVVLASSCTTSKRLVKPRRLLALTVTELPRLQDAIARFYGVRGFAALPALRSSIGKPIRDIVETGQTIHGPSGLIKVYFGGDGEAEADDEVTVAFWGVRPGPA